MIHNVDWFALETGHLDDRSFSQSKIEIKQRKYQWKNVKQIKFIRGFLLCLEESMAIGVQWITTYRTKNRKIPFVVFWNALVFLVKHPTTKTESILRYMNILKKWKSLADWSYLKLLMVSQFALCNSLLRKPR